MARANPALVTFNRGQISTLALARVDLERTGLSAAMQYNWVPRTLGSMMLRPGLEYIGAVNNSSTARLIPFVFSATDTALLEVTSTAIRAWVRDALVTRLPEAGRVTLGDFSSTLLGGWTDADDSGATSEHFTGNYLSLVGTPFARARRQTMVTLSTAVANIGLKTVVNRGRVSLRVGSSTGGEDIIAERVLRPGTYSFALNDATSTGDVFIELNSNTEYRSLVESIQIESSGPMILDSTWAGADLDRLRWDQSADVMFVANSSYKGRRIERYSSDDYGYAEYDPLDGPFRTINITNKRLEPYGLTGNITLACDQPLFQTGHVGALFRITSVGQEVSVTPSAADQFSNSIRVTGVGDDRKFKILITDVGSTGYDAMLRVQRSVGDDDNFNNVTGLTFTSSADGAGLIADSTHDDGLDNQIVFYRIGVASTYTDGSPTCELIYERGGITGIVKIESVISATESSASVLSPLGSTDATELWNESEWSTFRGWPTAVALHEGRLWWAGRSKIIGSISDAFESFDEDVEGDSARINRTIGSGGVETIEWIASLGRLIIGGETRELQVKTGSLEEPVTPTNFNLRDVSSQGSHNVQMVKIDQRGLFVQQAGQRIYELHPPGQTVETYDYAAVDRTALVPEMGEPSVIRLGVQRQPDTRVHAVRSDGTVAMLVSDRAEDVAAWIDIASTAQNGGIEDVAVLPSTDEDAVYYIVRREINGSTVRYLERWAKEAQGRGGSSNRLADSHKVVHTTSTSVATLSHLAGSTVVVWSGNKDKGEYLVSPSGVVTLDVGCSTSVLVGLPYEAWYKSAKLAYAAEAGTALGQRKSVDHIALLLAHTHTQGVKYGPSTDSTDLDELPLISAGATISTDAIHETFDEDSFEFNGTYDTDSRVVLRAVAPRPATVLALVMQIDTKEKT